MLRSLPLLLLLGCVDASDDGSKAADDTAADFGPNPVVPEAYALLWDLDASSCDDANAIAYFVFNGTIDDNGALDGEEKWYWFFDDEGWEGDCYSTFDVTGEEGTVNWSSDPCSGCDREFLVEWELQESSDEYVCQGFGYESLFDDDEKDRIDEELYSGDIMLDTLSPSGNVNANMLVFAYTQDDEDEYSYNSRPDSRGDYYPDEGADYATGSASLEWVVSSGICVDFN